MSQVQIKICGITRMEDALAAIDLGVEMLGLNFHPASPRFIELTQAQQIAAAVTGRAKIVGVFVNMNLCELQQIARAVPLDAVQLHGDESPEDCGALASEFEVIRALKVDEDFDPARAARYSACKALLLDAPHGGSGEKFDWGQVPWNTIRAASGVERIFLAGGLHAGNVEQAIAVAHPDVVDVASGVESSKGIKSASRMREFVAAVRAAERQLA